MFTHVFKYIYNYFPFSLLRHLILRKKYQTIGWFTGSEFRIRYLLKFKEVTDANQDFYELKQCQRKRSDPKIGSCEQALKFVKASFSIIYFTLNRSTITLPFLLFQVLYNVYFTQDP